MANWNGLDRTNYFKVKDIESFKRFTGSCPGVTLIQAEDDNHAPLDLFGVYVDDGEGWPSGRCVRDADGMDEEVEFEKDFETEILAHAVEGEVVVFISAGFEGARYASGTATAFVTVKGETKFLQIKTQDIYALAAKEWGIEPNVAEL